MLSVGTLPLASDRAGRDDKELDALVAATFADRHRLAKPGRRAGGDPRRARRPTPAPTSPFARCTARSGRATCTW